MKCVSSFYLLLFVPFLLFAGTMGKISGKVTEMDKGKPLVGVNIFIENTTYQTTTDTIGNYVFFSVPAGFYSLRAVCDGYRQILIENIRIHADLTCTVNFELQSGEKGEEDVEFATELSLIQSNSTNSVLILTSDEIRYKPLRGYRALVGLAPGAVTDADGNTFVRGGRIEETAYYLDGVYQNNLRTGMPIGNLSAYALEEVSVQAGGFNAEYGFAASGIVNAITRTGGPRLTVFGEVITDQWLSRSTEQLGAYSYGYNVVNLAVSGPLPILDNRVRFFASVERDYFRDATPSLGVHPVMIEDKPPFAGDAPTPADIDIAEGHNGPIPNNDQQRWLANANISFDFHPFKFKIGGNMTEEMYDEALIWNMLANSNHNPHIEQFSQSFYAQMIYTPGSHSTFNGQVNYFADGLEIYDPVLKRDIVNYGDKTDYNSDGIFNPDLPNDGINKIYEESTAKLFAPAGRIYNNFTQNRSRFIGFKFDFMHQIDQTHEFKTGLEFRFHTLKRYKINPISLASAFANNPDMNPVLAYANSYTDAYGYDFVQDPGVNGDLTEGSLSKYDKAKHPIISAIYVQDKIETSDLIMNLGFRLDYFDANAFTVEDPLNIKITTDGLFDRSQLVESKTHITVSPRVGVAFPISSHTSVYGQYGKFAQQPPYELLFSGWELIANEILLGGGAAPQNADLGPVKTTAYEVGFRHQFGDYAALDIAAYYKQISDLVRLERLGDALPKAYYHYKNGDYGTVKGFSINLNVSDNSRLSASLSYTYQFAGATGSSASSNDYIDFLTAGGENGYPTYVAATDFDQRHSGRLSVNLQFAENEGPALAGFKPLANFNIGMLLTFGSGFSYTLTTTGDPIENGIQRAIIPRSLINSAYGPWQVQVDMLLNRHVEWGSVDFDIYLWAINIFGSRNWDTRMIYGATGDNADPGYLDSSDGKTWIAENGGEPAANLYQLRRNSPDRWAAPRQLRIGLRFNIIP